MNIDEIERQQVRDINRQAAPRQAERLIFGWLILMLLALCGLYYFTAGK